MTTTKDPGPPAGLCDVARTVDAASVWAAAYAISMALRARERVSRDGWPVEDVVLDGMAEEAETEAELYTAAWKRRRTRT